MYTVPNYEINHDHELIIKTTVHVRFSFFFFLNENKYFHGP